MGSIKIIDPTKPNPHTHTIVFLHGRGDNALAFSNSLNYSRSSSGLSLIQHFPTFRWVFPSAPLTLCASDSQVRSQWFDIWNVSDFSDREDMQRPGLRDSVQRIRQIVLDEIAALDGHAERVVLAGISQGAATSVHVLLNLNLNGPDARLGAFLGFSCRMPFPGRSLADTRRLLELDDTLEDDSVLKNTPVLLEHCVDDPLVSVQLGRALRDTLQGFGMQGVWKEYASGGHWFKAPEGIDDVVKFLQKELSR